MFGTKYNGTETRAYEYSSRDKYIYYNRWDRKGEREKETENGGGQKKKREVNYIGVDL